MIHNIRASVLGLGMTLALAITSPAHSAGNMKSENAWLEIDATHFEHNLRTLQEQVLAKGTRICVVMKADAYGHGIRLLIPTVIKAGIDTVCIADNNDAKAARDGGFTGRLIRIRAPAAGEISAALPYGLEEIAGTVEAMRAISEIGVAHNTTIKVHLNLNSAGMGRGGLDLDTEEARQEVLEAVKLPGVQVVGIMTHFPDEDKAKIEAGLAVFTDQSAWLTKEAGIERNRVTLHCANTAAAVLVPQSHLDMVRVGSLLYGQQPADSPVRGLKPVMALKAQVASIHEFQKGDTIGYDRTFTLVRDSRLANIPIGYSDGYYRAFSNRAQVLIDGRLFPVVGKVTMNTIMVDVTDGANVGPGDEVVLLGSQGAEEITMSELMADSYTFYGEFFVSVGNGNAKFLKAE